MNLRFLNRLLPFAENISKSDTIRILTLDREIVKMNPRTCEAHENFVICITETEVSEAVEKPSEKNGKIPLPTRYTRK